MEKLKLKAPFLFCLSIASFIVFAAIDSLIYYNFMLDPVYTFGTPFGLKPSTNLVIAVAFTVSVTATMLLEIILDFFHHPSYFAPVDMHERLYLVLTAIFPGALILHAFASENPFAHTILVVMFTFQYQLFLAPIFFICWKSLPAYFHVLPLVCAYVLWTGGLCFNIMDLRGLTVISWTGICGPLCILLSQALMFRMCFFWMKDISQRTSFLKSTSNSSFVFRLIHAMTEDEFSTFLYLVFTEIFLIMVPCLVGSTVLCAWMYCDSFELACHAYCHTLFSALTSLIPGRNKEFKAVSNLLQQKIDVSHAIVRYVSHEIRSPLSIVINGIQLLKNQLILQQNCSNEVMSDLADIEHASISSSEIVDDLLYFERASQGTFPCSPNTTEAVPAFSKMVQLCKIAAKSKNIGLTLDYKLPSIENDTDVFCVNVDQQKMEQVVRNLIVNASKFTPCGGEIKIQFRISRNEHSAQSPAPESDEDRRNSQGDKSLHKLMACLRLFFCKFKVQVHSVNFEQCSAHHEAYSSGTQTPTHYFQMDITDSGVGMTKPQCEKLFHQFVQFNPNILQSGGGSGLGLWICQEIVTQHGGSLSVVSNGEGKGTTFTLKLECFKMPQENLPKKELRALSSSPKSTNTRQRFFHSEWIPDIESMPDRENILEAPERILSLLVVDDQKSVRKMNIKMLKRIAEKLQDKYTTQVHFEIEEEDDGLSALQLMRAKTTEFAAVFIDYTMIHMNGPEAVKEMRENLGFEGLIVGMTGNAVSTDVAFFKTCGANEVLTKPISFPKLCTIVETHLLNDMLGSK